MTTTVTEYPVSINYSSTPTTGPCLIGTFYFEYLRKDLKLVYLFIIIYCILFLIGCIGNTFVIILIGKFKQLQGAPAMLLANLAVSDLLVCLTYFPIYIYTISQDALALPCEYAWYYWWNFLIFLEFLSQVCSASTIAAINIERCFVVKYPLRVRTVITFRRKLLITASIWVISILYSIHIFIPRKPFYAFKSDLGKIGNIDQWKLVTQICIPAVILVVTCVISTVTLYKKYTVTNTLQEGLNQQTPCTQDTLKNTKKAIETVITVAVFFLCMTTPFSILCYLWEAGYRNKYLNGYATPWFNITDLIKISNSCVNPFIYVFMSSNFRSAIKSLFCCETTSASRHGGHV